MKPSLYDVQSLLRNSIHVKEVVQKSLSDQLHYHNAYEIALILKGNGRRIVGDSVDRFVDGDLTIMPPYMPHATYTESKHHVVNNDESIHAIVIYFMPDWFEDRHYNSVDFAPIRLLFSNLKRGIRIAGERYNNIVSMINEISVTENSLDRLLILLHLIKDLATNATFEYLASSIYQISNRDDNIEKINKIYKYVMENFTNKISLEEVAEIAFMTPPAFCKYFKNRTNKTFSNFVNEIRIGYACELLLQGNDDISSIAYHAGFNNLTSFNKNFKKFTKLTPSEYRMKSLAVMELAD
ncbi:AraC family transcriptional regulator [Sphingobacterium composti Ten et al. 2007 non Yoo et al. 2007]|uniref:AraC family transcriptional regulator n=1 Tax=Sphingobacterium composti TaxID=363260 RepID=UPI0013579CF5|nr:AraC family transcriptional regulator [Sphingobacterium composti Ten et al. 2007 non Yoo et al. 2007]